jgi:hypothetical protein
MRASAAVPIAYGEPEMETDGPGWERRPPREHRHEIIDSNSAASKLRINERAGLTEAVERPGDALAAFLDETDFGAETVVLESTAVADCFELQLCTVDWSETELETDYTRVLRSYETSCAADGRAFESRLIRIPEPLDSDAVTSYSTGIDSHGRCRQQPGASTATDSGGESHSESGKGGGNE